MSSDEKLLQSSHMQLFPLPPTQFHWFHMKPNDRFDQFETPRRFCQDITSLLVKMRSVLVLQINPNPSLTAPRFRSARAGLEAKQQRHRPLCLPLFVLLCCESLLLPMSAGRWQQAEASAGGGVSFPRTELRQVSSAAPLTSSWILSMCKQPPRLEYSNSDECQLSAQSLLPVLKCCATFTL